MLSSDKPATSYNYDGFVRAGTPLMVAMVLIDDSYEEGKDFLPSHVLEFDLGRALRFDGKYSSVEDGEIKSSTFRMFLCSFRVVLLTRLL